MVNPFFPFKRGSRSKQGVDGAHHSIRHPASDANGMSFTTADAGSRICKKLCFANHTIFLYRFDPDPDLLRPGY
jgi:hypothetical protein